MLGAPFYFHTLRNLVVGFGDLLNDVHVITLDSEGNQAKDIRVPIAPSRTHKYLSRLREDNIHDDESESAFVEMFLPRMSYEISTITPDPSRKLATLNTQIRSKTTAGLLKHFKQYSGNPYTVGFELAIYTANLDDMLQIIEQITPYFVPDFNITIVDIPELDLRRDIPITLDGITTEDTYEGLLTEYRIIQWNISFSANMYMYPPVQEAEVIRRVITNIKENVDKTNTRLTTEVDPIDALQTDDWSVKLIKEDDPTT